MVSHPKVERPWEMVSTDLMGPLPRSKHGNTFILVVTDYLSKFSLLFPLKRATSETVIRKLEDEVFLLFGVPRLLLCDNGPQYRRLRGMETKLTPYFVNFGRNMALSGDDYAESKLFECEEETQGVESSRNESFDICSWMFENAWKGLGRRVAKEASPKVRWTVSHLQKISPWMYDLRDQAGNPKGVGTQGPEALRECFSRLALAFVNFDKFTGTLMIVANRAIGASTKGKEEVEAKRNPYSKGFGGQSCYLDEPTVACYEAAAHSRGTEGCTNTTEGPINLWFLGYMAGRHEPLVNQVFPSFKLFS
ncbi:hypothetical protein JTB14_023586 [Gonioctena quinquepunctata]|nr:hypothetical protein JTB14_023586 [Gonioctena quinquepunctata]